MKRLTTLLMLLIAMTIGSQQAFSQAVTIILNPGWTWISYSRADTLDFDTALGTFTPMEGDIIKSQYGFAMYQEGHWSGGIQQFYPGLGYMYYSMRTVPTPISFGEPAPQVIVMTAEPTDITMSSAVCGGNVASSNGEYVYVTNRGICWSTNPNPTFNDNYIEVGDGFGSFTVSLTELTIGTTYYVRAFAVTENGTFYGEQKTFSTRDGIPTLTTADISNITGITATCGGIITDDGGLTITARGVCWSLDPNPTTADSYSTDGEGVGDFISSLSNLSFNTTYYVRAYATTTVGTGYGEQKCFTTRDGIPTVTTAEVTNVQGATATCGGNITDNGGLNVTARGVCWSTSPNPTVADSHTTNGSGTGSFNSSITGLSVSATYYVRAYATTVAGTAYGEEITFTTRDGIPTLTTANVTNIGSVSAICGGNVSDDGGLAITAHGVCWSNSPNPTINDTHTIDGDGIGNFISNMDGLSLNTIYYVRAYATNNHITAYGNEISFTTVQLWTNGILPGCFSVSAGRQVQFSQGNLQYQTSTNTWRFAENQFDCIGAWPSNSGWIDLFGWGTSGYNHGPNCYQPWSSSTNNWEYYAYGSYIYNLYDQTGQADWGYNAISNGGNQESQWRTLTIEEWQYVLFTRTTISGIRYAKANINGENGVILLPDNWDTSTYSLSNTNTTSANFSSNNITAEDWTDVLEASGAVFLPAAGYRVRTTVYQIGFYGYYWSASCHTTNGAYYVEFYDSDLGAGNLINRYYGQSVRLVQNAE